MCKAPAGESLCGASLFPSPLVGEGWGEGYIMVRYTNAPDEKARKATEVLASVTPGIRNAAAEISAYSANSSRKARECWPRAGTGRAS